MINITMYFSHFFPSTLLFILPLFAITPLVASLSRVFSIRFFVICLFTILITAELISIYFSGGLVDYQFFVNLNIRDITAGIAIFRKQSLLVVISFLIIILILSLLTGFIARYMPVWLRLILLSGLFYLTLLTDGPLIKLFEIYQITMANKTTFKESIEQFRMFDYVRKSDLKAQKGKNIIVISLESVERGFLDTVSVTPALNKLLTKYTYYPNMPMSMGSSWTVASMYTYMTGIPFLIGDFSTSPMDHVKQTQLVSLADVLKKANYRMRYVTSNPDFSGMGKIISMFGIDVVSEKNYPRKYPAAPFGLFDHDIFDIARREVDSLYAEKTPFALFISTISTHAPYGFKDERMAKHIDGYQDNMSFVVASLDYSLSKFISSLEENHILDNTVFYIFPDHLMMGTAARTVTKSSTNSRSLYMITNAPVAALGRESNDIIYQIDLPRLILAGANVVTNAKFLTDYLTIQCDKRQFVSRNKQKIAALNKAAMIH